MTNPLETSFDSSLMKKTNFTERSYLRMLIRLRNRSNSIGLLKTNSAFLWSFLVSSTFMLVDQNSQSTVSLESASNQKNEFSKYKQREHPSNDQLPSTRQGLHSIPNNPVRTKGVVLDCTLSIACCKLKAIQLSLMGMKDREGMFNC